jgi:hypothetical protein
MMVDYGTKHALPPRPALLCCLSRACRPPSAASAVKVCTKWSRAYSPDGISVEADSVRDWATYRRCSRRGPPSGKRKN